MRVFLRNDYETLSLFAAEYLISLLKTKEPGEFLNVALPCGYTVQRMYAILGEKVKAKEISLANLRVFHIDEFLDLTKKYKEHQQIQWMHDNLYSKVRKKGYAHRTILTHVARSFLTTFNNFYYRSTSNPRTSTT